MDTTTERLPRIIQFLERTDSGEYGNATCPHCGADGRYIQYFVTEDGQRRGAMAGCIQKFPISAVARKHGTLLQKADRYAKQGWTLNKRDQVALAAIEAYYRGEATEGHALGGYLPVPKVAPGANKYAGPCGICGAKVAEGAGIYGELLEYGWGGRYVRHTSVADCKTTTKTYRDTMARVAGREQRDLRLTVSDALGTTDWVEVARLIHTAAGEAR